VFAFFFLFVWYTFYGLKFTFVLLTQAN